LLGGAIVAERALEGGAGLAEIVASECGQIARGHMRGFAGGEASGQFSSEIAGGLIKGVATAERGSE
jgi:hypothetical protein